MNIYKNTKLFPNIRGVMLKENRTTLTMNGKYNITELRDGADARIELFFSDHPKSAVINSNQALIIADVYGPDTDDWKDKPVVLYGEEGDWFGKHQWGIRVDYQKTLAASKKAKKNGGAKKGSKPPVTPDDIPFDDIDPADLELAEMIMNDGEQSDLFAD